MLQPPCLEPAPEPELSRGLHPSIFDRGSSSSLKWSNCHREPERCSHDRHAGVLRRDEVQATVISLTSVRVEWEMLV